jgi:hypothetical protein
MPDRQDDLNPASDLAPFADALQRLAPQPPHLSRDALLFEAGKAAAAPRLAPWVWPGATATFAALSMVLGAFLASPGDRPVVYVDRPVYAPAVPPDRPPEPPTSASAMLTKAEKPKPESESSETARLLRRRNDVLRWGVDMLPESKPSAGGPSSDQTTRDTIHWLNLPAGTYAALPSATPKKPGKSENDDD